MSESAFFAAVDLGSNSFRLEIGRAEHGQMRRVEYLKETVRLGGGLDADRKLTPQAIEAGLQCLARFAERLRGFDPQHVRVVATQTLREARNRDAFVQQGSAVLGFPIELIPGNEEARLIYQGVAHLLPREDTPRLVIDIGGRSTEIILGRGFEVNETVSLRLGSVSWSMEYFPRGVLSAAALRNAEIAAQAVLEEVGTLYPRHAWQQAFGASGTVGAVADILGASGWSSDCVTREGLDWLHKAMLRAGHVEGLNLRALKDDRRMVLPGGVSVLRAVMDTLQIDTLVVAAGALRHGVLFEMLERADHDHDARDQSVQRLARKFGVDNAQAQRVQRVAQHLLQQLHPGESRARPAHRQLGWASALHEIGWAISHSGYHKHSAYVVQHADMLGFAVLELRQLALLVLGHRGKLNKMAEVLDDAEVVAQLLCLRLATIFCHARAEPVYDALRLRRHASRLQFQLQVPDDWARAHPQSMHLLREEQGAWERTDWSLEVAPATTD